MKSNFQDKDAEINFFEKYDDYNVVTKGDSNTIVDKLFEGIETKNIKVFEIGCGAGAFTNILSNKGFNIVGCDISLNLLRIAKKNTKSNIQYILCDAEHLPIKSGIYDVCFIGGVMHHIPSVSLLNMFYELNRVLRIGGHLLSFEPNGDNPLIRIGIHFVNWKTANEYALTNNFIKKLILTTNFSHLKIEKINIEMKNDFYLKKILKKFFKNNFILYAHMGKPVIGLFKIKIFGRSIV